MTDQAPSSNSVAKAFTSVLGLGYSPFASGTVASAAVCIPALLLPFEDLSNAIFWLSVGIFSSVFGTLAIARVQQEWGKDPSKVVIDEVAGMALVVATPLAVSSVWWTLTAFLFFRLYDIAKPFPANLVNSRTEPWSVMVDDLIAAVYSVVSLYAWQVVINVLGPVFSR